MSQTSNIEAVLRDTIDQILGLEEQIDDCRSDQKEFYASLKSAGFDVPAVRKVVARMKKDRDDVLEADESIHTLEQTLKLKMPDW